MVDIYSSHYITCKIYNKSGVFEEEKENELEKPTIHLESGGFAAIIEDLSVEEQGKLYEKFFQWLDSENVKYPKVSIGQIFKILFTPQPC